MRLALFNLTILAGVFSVGPAASAAEPAEQPIVATLPGQAPATDSLSDYTATLNQSSNAPANAEASAPAPVPAQAAPHDDSTISAPAQPVQPPPPAVMPPQVMASAPTVPPVAAAPSPRGEESLSNFTPPPKPADAAATTPSPIEVARGIALLPSRPEAEQISFSNTAAGEVVLRFAREYRVSVVLYGDGSTPITGWAARSKSVDEMLRAFFVAPEWTVTVQGGTYLVTSRPALSFRRVTFADLNPNLDPK